MITYEYFEKVFCGTGEVGPFPINPPTHVPNASFKYPSKYDIIYDEEEEVFRVSLLDFIQLEQSSMQCVTPNDCDTDPCDAD